jgi:hypothetical protein
MAALKAPELGSWLPEFRILRQTFLQAITESDSVLAKTKFDMTPPKALLLSHGKDSYFK